MTSTLRNDITPSTTQRNDRSERLLRRTLRLNAFTSAAAGSTMVLLPGAIDELLGTGHPEWIRVIGLLLVPFAVGVAWLSTGDRARLRRHVPGIVAGDAGWVVASIATIALGWHGATGGVLVGAMALAVDAFAFIQWWTWRRLAE